MFFFFHNLLLLMKFCFRLLAADCCLSITNSMKYNILLVLLHCHKVISSNYSQDILS